MCHEDTPGNTAARFKHLVNDFGSGDEIQLPLSFVLCYINACDAVWFADAHFAILLHSYCNIKEIHAFPYIAGLSECFRDNGNAA